MEQPQSSTSRPRKSPIPNPNQSQNPNHVQSHHHQKQSQNSQRNHPMFSSSLDFPSFGHQYDGLGRKHMISSTSQLGPPSQGSSPAMRPGVSIIQSSVGTQSTKTQSGGNRYSHGRGLLNLSTLGYPVSPPPYTTQNTPPPNQPGLSSRLQGNVPLPPPSQSLQQRSHIPQRRTAIAESDVPCTTLFSKRSIHELLNQVDPSMKLDPEVEESLVDIVDDFVESITTFGCLLTKHRKSTTLEPKDILLHLERNWHMTIPGFGGDKMKS